MTEGLEKKLRNKKEGANYIDTDLKPPFICLIISGGHTHLVYVKSYTEYEILGKTRDDLKAYAETKKKDTPNG